MHTVVLSLSQLVNLGLFARAFKYDEVGLWLTLLAIGQWLTLAYFGQASVLLSRVGQLGRGTGRDAEEILTNSLVLVVSVSVCLLVGVSAIHQFIGWGFVLKVSTILAGIETEITCVLALSLSILIAPTGLATFSMHACQRGDIANKILVLSQLLVTAAVSGAVWFDLPLWLVGPLSLSAPLLGGIACWIVGRKKLCVPRIRFRLAKPRAIRGAFVVGAAFLAVDASQLFLTRMPDFLVARLHGVSAVGPFGAVGRLPLLLAMATQGIMMPYFPALREARAVGDVVWVGQIVRRTFIGISALSVFGALAIWTWGASFIAAWTGSTHYADEKLIVAAGFQAMALSAFSWLSTILSARSQEGLLGTSALAAGALFLALALWWGTHFGPVGVAFAQAVGLSVVVLPLMLLARSHTEGLFS